MIASMTVLGAVTLQLKSGVKGREPEDMTTDAFWARAFIQGGGLGILGDFLVAETNRFGGGIFATIGGPQVGLVSDGYSLTIGNLIEAYEGEDTRARKEATDILHRLTPGGSLWQVRLIYERMIWDQVQLLIDPDAIRYQREEEKRLQQNTENDFYWAPEEVLPF